MCSFLNKAIEEVLMSPCKAVRVKYLKPIVSFLFYLELCFSSAENKGVRQITLANCNKSLNDFIQGRECSC